MYPDSGSEQVFDLECYNLIIISQFQCRSPISECKLFLLNSSCTPLMGISNREVWVVLLVLDRKVSMEERR